MNILSNISIGKKLMVLLAVFRDIPVIFLSSHSKEMYKSLGLALGAVDYITKPYESTLLLKRIEAHLEQQYAV